MVVFWRKLLDVFMKDRLIILCALLLTMATALRADEAVVVTFGDSTTATRADLRIYSQVLAEELEGVKVVNAGVGGHNTDHARARFGKDVRAHNPDVVVIQFGINDAAVDVWKDPPATESRVALADYEANLRHFVDTLNADGSAVILMTPNPLRWNPKMREMYGKAPYDPDDEDGFNRFLKSYAEKVRELSKEKKLPLVDVYRIFEEHGAMEGQSVDELLLDGVHPNEAGQRLVADALLPLVRSLVKKSGEVKAPAVPAKSHPAQWQRAGEAVLITDIVKCVRLAETEVAAVKADRQQNATRTSVATFDGFRWIHPCGWDTATRCKMVR